MPTSHDQPAIRISEILSELFGSDTVAALGLAWAGT